MWASMPATARVPSTIYNRSTTRYHFLNEDVLVGEICHMIADRAAPWSHFVVVWVSENRRAVGAIFPNVMKRDGMIRFGQDCTIWQPSISACKCPDVRQGDDFYCRCGAWNNDFKLQRELFVEAPRDYEYQVVKLALDLGLVYLVRGYDDGALNAYIHKTEYDYGVAREERRLQCKCNDEPRMCRTCYSGSK